MGEKLLSPGKRVCTVHCVSFKMHPMLASSTPCKLSLCADRAHACAGDSHVSSGIDVACPTTQNVLAIASPHELQGDSWPSSSTGTRSSHRNQQYSITAVTTSAGAIAERYAYSAYGQPTILDASASVLSSSAINNRYTYTGREWDATLVLHHFRARWMSPIAGRFLGRDPIGYMGSPYLLYEFLSGEVLTLNDPSGKATTADRGWPCYQAAWDAYDACMDRRDVVCWLLCLAAGVEPAKTGGAKTCKRIIEPSNWGRNAACLVCVGQYASACQRDLDCNLEFCAGKRSYFGKLGCGSIFIW